MKRTLKIICVFLIFISCINDNKPNQKDTYFFLQDSVFINIMVDVHLIEAARHLKYLEHNDSVSEMPLYYNALFEKHNITEAEFLTTYNHLVKTPLKMKEIMNAVIKKIEKEETKLIH